MTQYWVSRRFVNVLNYSPENTIDLKKLSEFSEIPVEGLRQLSFHYLLEKFDNKGDIPRSRVMAGVLHNEYHYCPRCLYEIPHHQLLWSIKDIEFCYKHHIELEKICIHCGGTILIKHLNELDRCPYCQGNLTDGSVYKHVSSYEEQKFLVDNYKCLIEKNDYDMSNRNLALKLLYLLKNKGTSLNKHIVCEDLNGNPDKVIGLIRRVRGTINQNLNIDFIMDILYRQNCSIETLCKIDVPSTFVASIINRAPSLVKRLSCQAPWCSRKNGSLIKTRTHSKQNQNGYFRYFVMCKECGCKFGITYKNEINGLTKFLGIYELLKNRNGSKISLEALSAESGFSFGMLRKAVAYFNARGVLSFQNYHIEFSDERLQSVIRALQEGQTMKSIGLWNIWSSQYEFLYYRYRKEIQDIEIARIKPEEKRVPCLNEEKIEKAIRPILKAMLANDEDIDVIRVCQKARISPTALRLWKGNTLVASAKAQQHIRRQSRRMGIYRSLIEQYFKKHDGSMVSSSSLYNFIGIKRIDLWRISPETTAELTERIKKHNRLLRNKLFK